MRAILAAHGNDDPVTARGHRGPVPAPPRDGHRVLVTEEDGGAVAFGAVVDTGRASMLADLFVRAGPAGTGPRPPLLAALFGDAPRRTTFASDDPRALPLYVRAGMTPLWIDPVRRGCRTGLADAARRWTCGPLPRRSWPRELAWTGRRPRRRPPRSGRRRPTRIRSSSMDAGRAGGVRRTPGRGRSRRPGHRPPLVRPGADPVPARSLASLAGRPAAPGWSPACSGPTRSCRCSSTAVSASSDRDQFLASDPALVDPAASCPNPGML